MLLYVVVVVVDSDNNDNNLVFTKAVVFLFDFWFSTNDDSDNDDEGFLPPSPTTPIDDDDEEKEAPTRTTLMLLLLLLLLPPIRRARARRGCNWSIIVDQSRIPRILVTITTSFFLLYEYFDIMLINKRYHIINFEKCDFFDFLSAMRGPKKGCSGKKSYPKIFEKS